MTGTVPSIPLIVSSIMSKKLAAGADVIVLDVKCGDGSFMKTLDDARELATEMVEIGKMAGRKTIAVITDMDEPLGHAVGNALEVKEAIATLRGEHKSELLELCLTLGACILTQAGLAADDAAARAMLEQTITDGSALRKLAEFVAAQDGDPAAIYDPSLLPAAPVQMEVPSPASGYVRHIAATDVGLVSMRLGGGRATKDSSIDYGVGIVLHKKGSRSRRSTLPTRRPHARRSRSSLRATRSPRMRLRQRRSSRRSSAEDNKKSRSDCSGSFCCRKPKRVSGKSVTDRRACADTSATPSCPRH